MKKRFACGIVAMAFCFALAVVLVGCGGTGSPTDTNIQITDPALNGTWVREGVMGGISNTQKLIFTNGIIADYRRHNTAPNWGFDTDTFYPRVRYTFFTSGNTLQRTRQYMGGHWLSFVGPGTPPELSEFMAAHNAWRSWRLDGGIRIEAWYSRDEYRSILEGLPYATPEGVAHLFNWTFPQPQTGTWSVDSDELTLQWGTGTPQVWQRYTGE